MASKVRIPSGDTSWGRERRPICATVSTMDRQFCTAIGAPREFSDRRKGRFLSACATERSKSPEPDAASCVFVSRSVTSTSYPSDRTETTVTSPRSSRVTRLAPPPLFETASVRTSSWKASPFFIEKGSWMVSAAAKEPRPSVKNAPATSAPIAPRGRNAMDEKLSCLSRSGDKARNSGAGSSEGFVASTTSAILALASRPCPPDKRALHPQPVKAAP